jgi:hypothetical protein
MDLRRRLTWLAIAGLVSAAGCARARRPGCGPPLPLGAPAVVAVGPHPIDVVAGDVDGDGDRDLVASLAREARMVVLLNAGDGRFTPAAGAVAGRAHLLALADVDRDGDLDLLSSDHDSAGVSVWLGDGRGGFAAAAGSPFAAHGGKPHNHGLAVGDVSGDGAPDVVTANQEDQSASVLLGDGRGGFSAAPGSPVRLPGQPYVSRLADADGDGKLDIVVPLISAAAVAVLRGNGRGGFALAPGSPHRTLERPYAVAVADVDGDDRPDVLAAHDDSDAVSVFAAQADGRLRPAPGSPLALGTRAFVLTTADLDGDGAVEVIGGAGDRLLILVGARGRPLSTACRSDLPASAWTVIAADLDGDGRPDLAAPDSAANAVKIWLSSRR